MQAAQLSLLFLSITLMIQACATTPKTEARRLARPAESAMPRPKLRLVNAPEMPMRDQLTTIGTYKVLRRVSMYYKLDLLKDNALSPGLAEIMRTYDDKMRNCYVARLDEVPGLKGQVALRFVVSRETGNMQSIVRIGGNLDDKALFSCLTRELASLPFNPPRLLKGRLLYSFSADESVAQAP